MDKVSQESGFHGLTGGRVVRVTLRPLQGGTGCERPATVVHHTDGGVITANVQFDAANDAGRVRLPDGSRVTGPVHTLTSIPHVSKAPATAPVVWDWPPR